MRFDRRKWSDCSKCPLNGQRKVWSECGVDTPRFVIMGEGPGEEEDRTGRPFVGPAGRLLDKMCYEAGVMRRNAWVTNVISCRPPQNKLDSMDGRKAKECCRPGLEAELASIKGSVEVFVPVGNHAMSALGLEPKITKRRGFVYDLNRKTKEKKHVVAIPTYHPAYLLKGNQKEIGTVIEDLRKVWNVLEEGWRPPREDFITHPTLGDLEAFRDRFKGKLVGVDIETTGLRPREGSIVVVGLSGSGEKAISFPVLKHGGLPYWGDGKVGKAAKVLLNGILKGPTMFQNASFDIPHLEINGFPVPNLSHDTILLHHAIHPELPHRLDYIVSLYGYTPYWKGEFQGRAGSILSMDDTELRTYNLRDAVVLHQVLPPLLEDLKIAGTERTYYDVSMKLVRPVLEMTQVGLLVDQDFLEKWKKELAARKRKLVKRFRGEFGISEELNLGSDQHLNLLFHSDKPARQFLDAVEEYEAYDQPPPLGKNGKPKRAKRKDTKVYQELERKVTAFRTAPAFRMPSAWSPRRSDTGQFSYNEDAVLWMLNAIRVRMLDIESFVRGGDRVERERAELTKTEGFLVAFQENQKVSKLISTYTHLPIWPDGRIHPNFKIHGTATGRLSSGEERKSTTESEKFNAQNIPPEARRLIIAPPGYDFMKADFSGFEPAILAHICGDERVIEAYEAGISPHDPNTEDFFGITKDHPNWKMYRAAEKVWVLRRAYGGGLKGAYEGIMKDIPGLRMTYSEFCANDRRYRASHPAYAKWYDETSARLRAMDQPMIRNQFGRLRILLGTRDEAVRAGLDHDMQSTGADIINDAMIHIRDDLVRLEMKSHIVNQVHDELDFYRHKSERAALVRLVRKHMMKTYIIGGRKAHFQIELAAGPSWGELKEIKV